MPHRPQFAYPFGEARGGSCFTTLCFVVALLALAAAEKALLLLAWGRSGSLFWRRCWAVSLR